MPNEAAIVPRCALPDGRFRHVRPDVDHEQGRQRTDNKERAPPEVWKDEPVNHRRKEKAKRVALLQNPRGQPPRPGGQTFHRERGAEPPFSAHPDPVERAENQKHGVARRKSGQQFHQRIENDVHHQRDAPAEPIAQEPEDERAQRAHHEGEGDCECHLHDRNRKRGSDILDHEGEEKKIERVERPAEEAGEECPALHAIQRAIDADRFHERI